MSGSGSAGSDPEFPAAPGGQELPGSDPEPFAEFLWMENEEDFDRQVQEELREQEFLDRCLQEMLEEEEQRDWFIPERDLKSGPERSQEILSKSSLNPDAKEFIPGVKY
ncbi:polyadenylate-binding protein-interacting protein 2B-like [Cyanistes caeruleus]|uniref:polyadenylate-binding protein-interacting protein 2B-like n=1 Tax=Cyanistes caeruleus TaxID=156563 RepID=UPI000CDB2174|nr:polyadenylate-binding protein-interacting protein 2B-like [Cyanistes caeruleus]